MNHTITKTETKTYEVSYLLAECNVRYWEDATVDGIQDKDGSLIPCRHNNMWCPKIDLKTGFILNWEKGKTADIHYKVCDAGRYKLTNDIGRLCAEIEGYVPDIMSPGEEGCGDYVIMKVDKNGQIDNWKVVLDEFQDNNDDE